MNRTPVRKYTGLWLAACSFAAVIPFAANSAKAQSTGVSNPPPVTIEATPDETPVLHQKPSASVAYAPGSPEATAVQAQPQSQLPPASATTYGAYVPYRPAGAAMVAAPHDPDGDIVTSPVTQHESNEDAGIVTYVPSRPNEVPQGTLFTVRIRETVSTASTPVGTRFTAEVTQPMQHEGRVVIPVGSVLHGRVTVARGGRRIGGPAAIHLLPESVTLPDGTHYILHAQVIDTSEHHVTRINDEGTILRRDHVKGTLAAMSLTTGGAAATGAVFGGVPGAFIGAGIGAGVSTVWWLKQDRQEVVPQNTTLVFSLSTPMSITPLTMGTQ
ncbi:hypothetical protein HDF16_002528 [Granulicella aggregans]|uniref:Uncharacterized protein n=1 Tax=Granulicella aggregans TaxID=474949 RepID=A0A7W7ZDK6_9BACT|nr:hypothetical protein [Granulicella aggregans]MBB5057822.1 hypothetical protein [Granulicella aggregans]